MSTRVIELELKAPLHDVGPLAGVGAVLALLRWRGRPVGLLRVPTDDGRLRGRQWQAALARWCQQPATRAAMTEPCPLLGAMPAISIIVCTHERPQDLQRCLAGLEQLAAGDYEVIVVDNAPRSDATAAVVAAAGVSVRYLCEPRLGLNYARNCGWRAARHGLVAYVDDDTVPDAAWAATLARALAAPQVAGVAGLVLPLELETAAQEMFEVYCAHRRVFARREFLAPWAGLAPEPVVARTIEPLAPAAASVVGLGANMAFRRDWLARLGGFDPRLDGGTRTCSGGDTDMLARILAGGGRLVYLPEAFVWHRHRRDLASLRRCLFGYGVGQTSLAAKRLWEDGDLQAAVVAARWLAGPFVKAVARRWRGQPAVPAELLLIEAAGALLGPVRFCQEIVRQRQAGASRRSINPGVRETI